MRVRLSHADCDEPVLCKFDGTLDGLFESAAAKLGWRPASFTVGGARLASADDLEENDEVTCEKEAAAGRKRAAEGGASAAAGTGAADEQKLTVRVQDASGNEVFFKVKPATKVQKILKAFEEKQGVDPGAYRFHYDGKRLPDLRGGRTSEDTIADWAMEDGDQIDADVQVKGGAADGCC